jgi:electron transfer flavoprotein-quinone oxidoreductase
VPAVTLRYDVIVVGAGPAGSAAALVAARGGLEVLLVERGEHPGSKNVSGAAFYSPQVLEDLVPEFWRLAPVERVLTRRVISFTSPEASLAIDFRSERLKDPPYNGFTVLRPRFDRWFADQAVASGVTLLAATVVDDLLRDGAGHVTGVRVRRPDGDIEAPVVIACDGVNSFLAKRAGLRGELRPDQVSLGVKEVVGLSREVLEERFGLGENDGVTYEFVGSVSGGVSGGAFLYTNRETLSLGVIVQVASLADRKVPAHELLEGFKAHPSVAPLVRGGRLIEYSAHMVPEGGLDMVPRLFGDGLMVAGDAAGLCFATGLYLEGINYAIASGRAAGETAVEAVRSLGRSDASALRGYERRLDRAGVLPDFRRYRRAPRFVLSERVHSVYPELLTGLAERVLAPRGGRKRKLLPLARAELKTRGIAMTRLVRDLIEGGRAFGW